MAGKTPNECLVLPSDMRVSYTQLMDGEERKTMTMTLLPTPLREDEQYL